MYASIVLKLCGAHDNVSPPLFCAEAVGHSRPPRLFFPFMGAAQHQHHSPPANRGWLFFYALLLSAKMASNL